MSISQLVEQFIEEKQHFEDKERLKKMYDALWKMSGSVKGNYPEANRPVDDIYQFVIPAQKKAKWTTQFSLIAIFG